MTGGETASILPGACPRLLVEAERYQYESAAQKAHRRES
jgi:hypothetical protein